MRMLTAVMVAATLLGACAHQLGPRQVLEASQSSVGYRADNGHQATLTLNAALNPLVQEVAVPSGERTRTCFVAEADEVCFDVGVGEVHAFDVVSRGVRYPIRIVGVLDVPAAVFAPDYQAAHRGHIQILAPEVYEMVNVAIALTDYAAANPGLVFTESEYYPRVVAHFGQMRSHRLVIELDSRMQREPILAYIQLKLNAYAFAFDAQDQIVRSDVYDRISEEDPSNALLPLIRELQSFADESGFLAFYATSRDFYQSQVAYLRDSVDAPGMWRWLQEQFPGVRAYDGVKIIFSPLVGSIQNLVTFESNGYRELQPHINFPYSVNPNLSAEGNATWRGTLLFGEMNHGFINPTAERYSAEIDAAIIARDFWTTEANSVAYPDDQSLFNEYLNFGLITLYHHDRMNEADESFAQRRIESVMVEGRGFTKFAEFNGFLWDLYANRRPGQTISDLYPEIVAWFAAQSAAEGEVQLRFDPAHRRATRETPFF